MAIVRGVLLASLGTILDSALTGSPAIYTLSGLSEPLTANARYWIELSTSDQSSAEWWWTTNTTGTGVLGEYWLNNYSGGVIPNAGGSGFIASPYEMRVLASTVPLPAALPLFASGLGAMGLLGWRRKRKAQAV